MTRRASSSRQSIPLVRAAPPIYRWRIRRKIYVWYKDLRELETAGRNAETLEDRMEVRARLADLQAEAAGWVAGHPHAADTATAGLHPADQVGCWERLRSPRCCRCC